MHMPFLQHSNNTYSHRNLSVSVQNNSNSSPLASMSLVFRGVTATSINHDSTSYFPNLLTQAMGKFQHQNLPTVVLQTWELSSNQLERKNFHKTLQILSQDPKEHLLRKSIMQYGSYMPIGCHRKKVNLVMASLTVIANLLIYLLFEK